MNGTSVKMQRVATWLMTALVLLLTAILVLFIWGTVTGRASTHDQILHRQDQIDAQLVYISCLLLLEPVDRTPAAVADCQLTP